MIWTLPVILPIIVFMIIYLYSLMDGVEISEKAYPRIIRVFIISVILLYLVFFVFYILDSTFPPTITGGG